MILVNFQLFYDSFHYTKGSIWNEFATPSCPVTKVCLPAFPTSPALAPPKNGNQRRIRYQEKNYLYPHNKQCETNLSFYLKIDIKQPHIFCSVWIAFCFSEGPTTGPIFTSKQNENTRQRYKFFVSCKPTDQDSVGELRLGPVSRKSRRLFEPENPFVKL